MMIIIHETDRNNFTPIDLGNCVTIEIAKKKKKNKKNRKKEKKKECCISSTISRAVSNRLVYKTGEKRMQEMKGGGKKESASRIDAVRKRPISWIIQTLKHWSRGTEA